MDNKKDSEEFNNPRIIVKGLRQDLRDAITESDTQAVRGALFAAAIKRFKSMHYLKFIAKIEKEHNLDVTPRLAQRLCFSLFDRKPSQAELQKVWQKHGRSCTDHSQDFERIGEMKRRYGAQADDYKEQVWLSGLRTLVKERAK